MENAFPILETDSAQQTLRAILIRFIASVLTINSEEAISTCSLTLLGREELRMQQADHHTSRSGEQLPLWRSMRTILEGDLRQ
jgi:hypothetical protein